MHRLLNPDCVPSLIRCHTKSPRGGQEIVVIILNTQKWCVKLQGKYGNNRWQTIGSLIVLYWGDENAPVTQFISHRLWRWEFKRINRYRARMLYDANLIDASDLWIEMKKNFCLFVTVNWYTPAEQPAPNMTEANKILPMMNRSSSHQE